MLNLQNGKFRLIEFIYKSNVIEKLNISIVHRQVFEKSSYLKLIAMSITTPNICGCHTKPVEGLVENKLKNRIQWKAGRIICK